MNMTRTEILPGIFLNYLHSDKFKFADLSIYLLTQLSRDTASANALIPMVLRRGTVRYPDMEALCNRLDELYGASVEPAIRKIGEIQLIGLSASYPEAKYLPQEESVTKNVISLLGEMLLNPITRGGLFLPAYVESEKEKMADIIRSRINNKSAYAIHRCIEEMFCYEDYSVSRLGSEDDCLSLNYKKLSKHYREVLSNSPVEIFYCGQDEEKVIARCVKNALCTMPRGEIDYSIGTDVRLNAIEEAPRFCEEEMDVSQGKIVIGFRLGDTMEEPDKPAISMFNCIYGAGITSKLFTNVRERLQLCYFAQSSVDVHKGYLIVCSGIDFDKFEAVRDEILHQIAEMADGNITDEEMALARRGIQSDLSSMLDSPMAMQNFYLGNILDGQDVTPDEYSQLIDMVTKEDLIAIARNLEPDMIYFLRGGSDDGEEDADEEFAGQFPGVPEDNCDELSAEDEE